MNEKKVSKNYFCRAKEERGKKNERRETPFPSFGGCDGGSSF